MSEADLSFEQVTSVLRCDPENGLLFWKERPLEMFPRARDGKSWNTRYAGKEASTAKNDTYRQVCIFYQYIRAHRIIWMFVHGNWPNGEIDHIDGDRSNNRIKNLRLVTDSENRRNSKRPSNNVSGVMGVYWRKDLSKWEAKITVSGSQKHIGTFCNFDEAVVARKSAEAKYGYHENHGRS